MLMGQLQQLAPEVRIQGRLFVGLDPAMPPPALRPALLQAVDDVFAVGIQLHDAGLFQCPQTLYHGGQLHPVVGGARFAAGHLLLMAHVL